MQDIVLKTDNVLSLKEKYYSPVARQSYAAELPPGYSRQFEQGMQALALAMYFGMQASEPKIHEFFAKVGIEISEGQGLFRSLFFSYPERIVCPLRISGLWTLAHPLA